MKETALDGIKNHDWAAINQTTDLTTLNDRIEQTLRSTLDKIAPWTCIRQRGDNFVTDINLRSKQQKRNKQYAKWKRSQTSSDYNIQRTLNEEIKRSMNNLKINTIK